MKNELKFGWKEVGELWWMFAIMIIMCGMVLWVAKAPRKINENKPTTITVTCSKEIEDRECAGRPSPECEPECHDCKKMLPRKDRPLKMPSENFDYVVTAETKETANGTVIYDYKGEEDDGKIE